MDRFIDREQELRALESFWRQKSAQFVVMYGKRRVGKTSLIKRFIQDKLALYFLADNLPENANLRRLGATVGGYFGDSVLERAGFPDWYSFFEYLKEKSTGKSSKRLVLAIDEFPYLATANKALSSVFQQGWDETLGDLPLMLILCGSSISVMESQALAQKAPLYGRRTGQLMVRPFGFSQAKEFFPAASTETAMQLFTIAGGNPAYLKQLDPRVSVKKNVVTRVLAPESFLYEEVEFILREELREPRNYFNILRTIAHGRTKFGEIVNETGYDKGKLHPYLFALEDLHLIEREVPVTEKNPARSRKGRYRLQDQFVKFWFTYVFPYRGEIEFGNVAPVLAKLTQSFEPLVGQVYEKVAQEVLREHAELAFPFAQVGRWWDKSEEIDVVAVNEDTDQVLFGEAKWSKRPVGTNIYQELRRKSALVEWGTPERKERFCLFSKSGFTPDMRRMAREDRVLLFEKDRPVG